MVPFYHRILQCTVALREEIRYYQYTDVKCITKRTGFTVCPRLFTDHSMATAVIWSLSPGRTHLMVCNFWCLVSIPVLKGSYFVQEFPRVTQSFWGILGYLTLSQDVLFFPRCSRMPLGVSQNQEDIPLCSSCPRVSHSAPTCLRILLNRWPILYQLSK